MYNIGKLAFSQFVESAVAVFPGLYTVKWAVTFYHKSGGIKKDFAIGQSESTIKQISFETNKKLLGACTIEFSQIDFPFDPDDYLEIKYKGNLVYTGIIDDTGDIKDGKLKIIPYHQKLKELFYNGSLTEKISVILQTIVQALEGDTDIFWNPFLVDIETADDVEIQVDYTGYEYPYSIFDKLVGKLNDREWGVDENNFFVVYKVNEVVDHVFLNGADPVYSKIDAKINWSKVSATRHQVFMKSSGGGESARVGEVGYGGSYPILEIEDKLRKKESKFNIPEVITDTDDALDIAYQNLVYNSKTPLTIKLSDIDLDRYYPQIGDLITVEDETEYTMRTIINCDSLTNDDTTIQNAGFWSGATIDTTDFITNSSSITFTDEAIYDFGHLIRFYNPIKIGFMLKSDTAGAILQVDTGKTIDGYGLEAYGSKGYGLSDLETIDLWYNPKNIMIPNVGTWTYYDYNIESSPEIQFFGIRFIDGASAKVSIDRIQLYLPHRTRYTANVVKCNFLIGADSENCDIELNDYDLQANDLLFKTNKRIEILESIQQS